MLLKGDLRVDLDFPRVIKLTSKKGELRLYNRKNYMFEKKTLSTALHYQLYIQFQKSTGYLTNMFALYPILNQLSFF